jgi:hypothetical protein
MIHPVSGAVQSRPDPPEAIKQCTPLQPPPGIPSLKRRMFGITRNDVTVTVPLHVKERTAFPSDHRKPDAVDPAGMGWEERERERDLTLLVPYYCCLRSSYTPRDTKRVSRESNQLPLSPGREFTYTVRPSLLTGERYSYLPSSRPVPSHPISR